MIVTFCKNMKYVSCEFASFLGELRSDSIVFHGITFGNQNILTSSFRLVALQQVGWPFSTLALGRGADCSWLQQTRITVVALAVQQYRRTADKVIWIKRPRLAKGK